MPEFLRITKETLTKENIVELPRVLDDEEAIQEERDEWEW